MELEYEKRLRLNEASDGRPMLGLVYSGHTDFAPAEAPLIQMSLRQDRPNTLQAYGLSRIARVLLQQQRFLQPQQQLFLQTLFCTAAVAYCYVFRFATAWL